MTLWDDKKLFNRVIDRLTQREKGYVKFNKARDSIIDYFRPDLGSDTTPDGDGSFFAEGMYDGTAPWAARVMSAGFQGNLVSAAADWIQYQMQQSELADNDQLDMWLQDVKEHNREVYQRSNIYKVLPPFTLDGVTIGSPVMMIEETDVVKGVISFLPQHYKTVFVFYDKSNMPEGVIIKDKRWTTKQIADKFAKTKEEAQAKLSKNVFNQIENGHWHKEHTIIRAIFKNSDPIWDGDNFKKPAKDWISVYFEEKPAETRKDEPLLT